MANGSLQTVDIGSFTGSVNVDFGQFDNDQNRCQKAEAPAAPTGGSPNIADDVIMVSPPGDCGRQPDPQRQAGAGNLIRDRGLLVRTERARARSRPGADELPLRHLRRALADRGRFLPAPYESPRRI